MSEKGATASVVHDPRQVEHRRVWFEKPALRVLYADYHSRLTAACPDGPLLDIGGGTAHIKQVRRDVLSVDILPFPGIDAVCDAHCLAFPDRQFAGVIMIDVLHHLERPIAFLKEAARVLRPRGVLAMIEPGKQEEIAAVRTLRLCGNLLSSGDGLVERALIFPSTLILL